jgi:hypothetical protein
MPGCGKHPPRKFVECLAFAEHHDPMVAGIAVERLLAHCQAFGMVLMIAGG